MSRFSVAVLAGDGIGPEVTAVAVAALCRVGEHAGRNFEFRMAPVGAAAFKLHGDPLPQATLDLCLASDAVLLGAVGDPSCDRLPAAQRPEAGLLRLRAALGGYANLRPVTVSPSLLDATPFKPAIIRGVDLIIVRELLGGLYFGQPRGRSAADGMIRATDTLSYTEPEIERIAHTAFRLAAARRRFVASVDKANVLESSRLWREVVTRVAAQYPAVRLEHHYVDSFALALNLRPRDFDVVLTENTFGDILSDQAAAFCGSLGLLASATVGGRVGLFEPIHGSAPPLAGRDLANPLGAVRTAAMLLRHAASMPMEAEYLETAVENLLASGARTADLAAPEQPVLSTTTCGEALLAHLDAVFAERHAYHAV